MEKLLLLIFVGFSAAAFAADDEDSETKDKPEEAGHYIPKNPPTQKSDCDSVEILEYLYQEALKQYKKLVLSKDTEAMEAQLPGLVSARLKLYRRMDLLYRRMKFLASNDQWRSYLLLELIMDLGCVIDGLMRYRIEIRQTEILKLAFSEFLGSDECCDDCPQIALFPGIVYFLKKIEAMDSHQRFKVNQFLVATCGPQRKTYQFCLGPTLDPL